MEVATIARRTSLRNWGFAWLPASAAGDARFERRRLRQRATSYGSFMAIAAQKRERSKRSGRH